MVAVETVSGEGRSSSGGIRCGEDDGAKDEEILVGDNSFAATSFSLCSVLPKPCVPRSVVESGLFAFTSVVRGIEWVIS